MKKLLIIAIILTVILVGLANITLDGVKNSFNEATTVKYQYTWDIEVTYLNGDSDNITCEFDVYSDNECKLIITEGGSLKAIENYGLLNSKVIVNGVKKFTIISEGKQAKETEDEGYEDGYDDDYNDDEYNYDSYGN